MMSPLDTLTGPASPDATACSGNGSSDADLLAAALEGLYVGRDNKALIVAKSGEIVSINSRASELCQRGADALIGRSAIGELFDEPAQAPDGQNRLARWETTLKTGAGLLIPVEVVREPLGSRIPDARVYAVRDLRERKSAEAERERQTEALIARELELQVQNLRFDAAINNMRQALAMFDADGHLVVCNKQYANLYGVQPDEIIPGTTPRHHIERGHSKRMFGDVEFASFADAWLAKFNACENDTHELADGRIILISRRRMADGGLVSTTDDITEQERRKRQLDDYTKRLESSNKELQNFAYVASHDLQEPLRKIETFASRLIRGRAAELPTEVAYPLERIQDAAGRMRRLINDLLGFARLGRDGLDFQKTNLNDTLHGVLSDLQVRLEETGTEVHCDALPEIEADPTLMRQLLQNLLSNSIKFAKKEVAPIIRIRGSIKRNLADVDCLCLALEDNGIGLDNRYKDQIFQIFQRLNGRSEYEGSGIGLATCRKIVDQHGGTIEADGRPGEGTTFTVTLPIVQQRSA